MITIGNIEERFLYLHPVLDEVELKKDTRKYIIIENTILTKSMREISDFNQICQRKFLFLNLLSSKTYGNGDT